MNVLSHIKECLTFGFFIVLPPYKFRIVQIQIYLVGKIFLQLLNSRNFVSPPFKKIENKSASIFGLKNFKGGNKFFVYKLKFLFSDMQDILYFIYFLINSIFLLRSQKKTILDLKTFIDNVHPFKFMWYFNDLGSLIASNRFFYLFSDYFNWKQNFLSIYLLSNSSLNFYALLFLTIFKLL